jgi:lipopolysaccharide transport system ATP-binding protein
VTIHEAPISHEVSHDNGIAHPPLAEVKSSRASADNLTPFHAIGADPTEHTPARPVISIRNLGKCYHVYNRPQDRLKQALFRWKKQYFREFWALRNVSFEVFPGDSVGILGRNGGGKSTLLQLIAGTLTPTEGEVEIRGRIAAMLELGSGFNSEFTGRENVYLKGSILGIPRQEMEQRFDAIASFADIGEFMDQPLKTYSSGMSARLAFAVAFSVEPDVMIVDEILAVGDIGFQQRCLSRLRQLRDGGMTMLFVSHSPDAVRSVCDRALFLDHGQPRYFGSSERATDLYLAHIREQANQDALETQRDLQKSIRFAKPVAGKTRYGTGHVQIEKVELLDAKGEPRRAFRLGDQITLEATVRAHMDIADLSVSFLVRDMTGVDLMGTATFDERFAVPPLRRGEHGTIRFTFENTLRPGNFGISLAVNRVTSRDYSDNVLFDQVDGCVAFSVIARPDRPVHYKFHQPVSIDWRNNGSN